MADDRRPRAAALMVASAFAFAGMSAFVKLVPEVGLWEKVVCRNLVALVVLLPITLHKQRSLLGARSNQLALWGRSLLGIGGVVCYFFAIEHLLLADATMLNRISPFFVAVLGGVCLGERVSGKLVAALLVAFVGAVLIIKPRFDLSVVPALVGLLSSLFAAGAYIMLRVLRHREATETIVLHFAMVSVLGLLPLVLLDPQLPSLAELGWLACIGVAAACGQLWLTAAYRCAPAAEVSLYGYSMILFSALLGALIWSEVPDALSLLGGALIIIAAVGVYFFDRPSPTRPGTGCRMQDPPARPDAGCRVQDAGAPAHPDAGGRVQAPPAQRDPGARVNTASYRARNPGNG